MTSFRRLHSPVADTTKLTIKATLQAKILFGSSPFLLLRASALGRLLPDCVLFFIRLDRPLERDNYQSELVHDENASADRCTFVSCRSGDLIAAGGMRPEAVLRNNRKATKVKIMSESKQLSWPRQALAEYPALIVSVIYFVASLIGLVYSWAFLRAFGINVFRYAPP